MARTIIEDGIIPIEDLRKKAMERKESKPPDNFEHDEKLSDVAERQIELEELTDNYIMNVMGFGFEDDVSFVDLGFDPSELTEILDDFERVLYEHGIMIYHPVVQTDENGRDVITPSIYADI